MGYFSSPPPPPKLNIDKHGLPRDYTTYIWLHYHYFVIDESPARLAFIYNPEIPDQPFFGFSLQYDEY